MNEEEKNKAIAEYMSDATIPRFILSTDGGESMFIEFRYLKEAQNYLANQAMGWAKDAEIIDKSYYSNRTRSLDRLVPVIEKLGLDGFELYKSGCGKFWWAYTALFKPVKGETPAGALSNACVKGIEELP